VIDLAVSEEQEQLQDSFRSLFEKEAGPDLVREVEPLGFSPRLWQQVAALGAPDMAVPEAAGGAGAGLMEAALLAELAGKYLAPVPLVEVVVTNRLLARLGPPAADLLSEAMSARSVMSIAVASPDGEQLKWVPAGAVADRVLARAGDSVVVTTDAAPGEAVPNLGSLPLAHRLVAGARTLAEGSSALAAWHAALDEWRVLVAAWLTGAGRQALDISLRYTTERKAFGVPIASYQSVAHRLADIATALDGALLLHRKAAWAADQSSGRRRELALMAAAFAAETAELAATEALHFHGGYGFMLEYDIQLYLRRIKAVALLNGNRARNLRSLADELWGNSAAGSGG
jgi:alkylation response protein AidB-like acyl-CoA dehydrogenase